MSASPDTRHHATDSNELLRHYLDALTAGDLVAVADSFAEDATWLIHGTLPIAGTKHGRAEIMEFLTGAASLFQPDTRTFTWGDVTTDADRAVLEWRVRGVASATGRPYDNAYCGVFRFAGGRIVEVREYLDSLHVAEVLFGDSDDTAPTGEVA